MVALNKRVNTVKKDRLTVGRCHTKRRTRKVEDGKKTAAGGKAQC